MSNIYYGKKLTFSKLRILKFFVATLKSEAREENCVWLFYYFNFKSNYDVLKSRSPCILLKKCINLNRNETESKMENPTQFSREQPCVSAQISIAN